MRVSKIWISATGCFACVGMFLSSLASQAQARWYPKYTEALTMHRGLIAHTIHSTGNTGRSDPGGNLVQSSFSYPMGRNLKVYSGGQMRVGWNDRANSAGEGIWMMSNTGSSPHVSAAGSETMTADIENLPHDPSTYPEAYLGVVHDENWALSYRKRDGNEVKQAEGATLARKRTNWWPASGGISAAPTPIVNKPVMIWNFRYGRYNRKNI